MELLGIIALVVLLYGRTLSYNYIIDDNVKRDGYMYEVPLTVPGPEFYATRPSKLYRCFMIAMHCVNVSIIYMLWGWGPALLFAVHPMSVWGTAWVTGNYYATTAYFTLVSFFVLHAFPNMWGAMLGMCIFAAALNSTICAISFPFIYLFVGTPWGLSLFIPLFVYLGGKRFKAGIKIRDGFNVDKPVKTPFTYRRLALCMKVMAKYIIESVFPDQLGLFGPTGHSLRDKQAVYDKWHSFNVHFWASFAVCAALFIFGLTISVTGTVWFFLCIALHSQWRLTGQFYAQRYLYLAIVGLCIVAGTALQHYPIVITVVATFFVLRSHIFINAFRNIECLYRSDLDTYPQYAQVYNNVAQYFINSNIRQPWKINELGYLLFKAEEMEPDEWSIKMNIACWFAMIQQWQPCLDKTKEALSIVKPLGGPQHPVKMLEEQAIRIQGIINDIKSKQQAGAIVSPVPTPTGEKVGTNNG